MNDEGKSNNKKPFLAVDQSCDASKLHAQLVIFLFEKSKCIKADGFLSQAKKEGRGGSPFRPPIF